MARLPKSGLQPQTLFSVERKLKGNLGNLGNLSYKDLFYIISFKKGYRKRGYRGYRGYQLPATERLPSNY
jgi:hypothetical protein